MFLLPTEANRKIKEGVPFAVVGSNCLIDGADGKKIRGRKYPWGIVDVSKLYLSSFFAATFNHRVGNIIDDKIFFFFIEYLRIDFALILGTKIKKQ